MPWFQANAILHVFAYGLDWLSVTYAVLGICLNIISPCYFYLNCSGSGPTLIPASIFSILMMSSESKIIFEA